MPSRWPNAYVRIGAESVMAYIHFLDSECRRLAIRARNLEDGQDRLREQLYNDRHERVTWLSGELHEASQRMYDPVRKHRRDNEQQAASSSLAGIVLLRSPIASDKLSMNSSLLIPIFFVFLIAIPSDSKE
jgi:hypothetical protein